MHIAQRALTIMRGLLKRYGPSKVKRRLWDQEFSGSHWDFIDNTVGDCVYPHLEKYLKSGSLLDLGCGPGNTANELSANTYTTYVGVDISETALAKATKRTEQNGRSGKNSFACSDFFSYRPKQKFDVVLFRESMYHVPLGKVKPLLDHFSKYLKDGGVFIVRMNTTNGRGGYRSRLTAAIDVMEANFDVMEKHQYDGSGATVIAFRPRHSTGSGLSQYSNIQEYRDTHA